MVIVSAEKFIKAARDNGYAVGGFNINNLEWIQATLRTTEVEKVPTLIQTSIGAVKYMGGYKPCKALIENPVESVGITVPVVIHPDHGRLEDALEYIEVGYISVMFDDSRFPLEESLKKVKEVIAKAHVKGISVEAEVDTIGGEKDGIIDDGGLTPIEDAKAMVAMRIDFLAVGIDNIHGPYPVSRKGPHLDHLEKLTATVLGSPIISHDGLGTLDDQIQVTIKLGIVKVNVNTECQLAFVKAARKFVAKYGVNEEEYGKKELFDPRKLLKSGLGTITEAVEERIDVFGSASKA